MKYLVLCVTLNILFFINTVYSLKIESAKYDDAATQSVQFDVKKTITLSCNVSDADNASGEARWKKEDEFVEVVSSLKNRVKTTNKAPTITLTVENANEGDAGNYSCLVQDGDKITSQIFIRVRSTIAVRVPSNVNVVEGEKLKIHCQVLGNPKPELSWEFKNSTYNETYTESKDRVILEKDDKNVENAFLILKEVNMGDRGVYTCVGRSPVTGEELRSESMVRVKDQYAALWPFLGICAEVIILCAIIFIYEKKRNKTELEESDTDQSPDQDASAIYSHSAAEVSRTEEPL